MPDSFGAELKKRRNAAGLTQVDVAKSLGVSRPTIAQWEAGRHQPMSEHLQRLDELYGARGTLLDFGQRPTMASDDTHPGPQPPRKFLSDVCRDVADSLVSRVVRDTDGRPVGWGHNLLGGRPTPLSTAFVLLTLQLLNDVRIDLHAVSKVMQDRRRDDGWTSRLNHDGRPEATAIVLSALARLGGLPDIEADLAMLGRTLNDRDKRRPYILCVALECAVSIAPDAQLVDDLVRLLLDCRIEHRGLTLWTTDAAAYLARPSLAHTARGVAVLRAVRAVRRDLQLDEAIEAPSAWMAGLTSDEGMTELLELNTRSSTDIIPIRHFTSAWTIRALSGRQNTPLNRVQAALVTLWESYSPTERLWVWRADGTVPSWMTFDAINALLQVSLHGVHTPVGS